MCILSPLNLSLVGGAAGPGAQGALRAPSVVGPKRLFFFNHHCRAFMRACIARGELSSLPAFTAPLNALKFLLVHTGHFMPRA